MDPADPKKTKQWSLEIFTRGKQADEHPSARFEENGVLCVIAAVTVREITLKASYALLSNGPHWNGKCSNGDTLRITRHSAPKTSSCQNLCIVFKTKSCNISNVLHM